MYLLTNGNHYCSKTNTGRIVGTSDKKQAFRYITEELAKADISRATGKLKGFYLIEDEVVNTITNANVKTCKRIKFSPTTRKTVYRNSKGHCCLCGNFVDYDDFTVDHIIPLAKGGTNDIENLQCACKVCNNIKTDVLPNEFMDKITEMIVYNMNNKYNKIIGRKLIKMIISSNIHRVMNSK